MTTVWSISWSNSTPTTPATVLALASTRDQQPVQVMVETSKTTLLRFVSTAAVRLLSETDDVLLQDVAPAARTTVTARIATIFIIRLPMFQYLHEDPVLSFTNSL